MKIYRVDFHDHSEGRLVIWHKNKRNAERELARLQRDARFEGHERQGVEQVECVDIPTDKDGLIQWLNANLNTDNG